MQGIHIMKVGLQVAHRDADPQRRTCIRMRVARGAMSLWTYRHRHCSYRKSVTLGTPVAENLPGPTPRESVLLADCVRDRELQDVTDH